MYRAANADPRSTRMGTPPQPLPRCVVGVVSHLGNTPYCLITLLSDKGSTQRSQKAASQKECLSRIILASWTLLAVPARSCWFSSTYPVTWMAGSASCQGSQEDIYINMTTLLKPTFQVFGRYERG